MSVLDLALIHEARVWRTARGGAKDEQGERTASPEPGPWFPARRTTRGQPPEEGAGDVGGRKRGEQRWLLIWGDENVDGSAIDPPRASDQVEVVVDPDTPGAPSFRYEIAGRPEPYDDGDETFGGQAILLEVGDSA